MPCAGGWPFGKETGYSVPLAQEPRAPIGKGIDHRCRTVGREAVELGARTINVAGVKK